MGQRLSFLLKEKTLSINKNSKQNQNFYTNINHCDYCNKIILIDNHKVSTQNICSLCEEQLVLKRLKVLGIFN